jgi:hypothetical protein
MHNKFLFFFLFAVCGCYAQSFSTSPISYYGIGERSNQSQAIYSAIGYAGLAHFDSTQLNLDNPASYSFLSQGNTLFALGMKGKTTRFADQEASIIRTQFLLDQYALGFKLNKKVGSVFALRPYANRGYQITDNNFTGIDSIRYTYLGRGGMSEVLIGFGYRPLNTKVWKLSFGANIGYAFGVTEKIRRAQLMPSTSDYPAGEQNTLMRLNKLNVYTSALLQITPSNYQQIVLSGAYEPASFATKLSTVSSLSSVSLGLNGRPVYDVLQADSTDNTYNSKSLTLGISYTIFLPKWRIQTRELHPSLKMLVSYRSNSSFISGGDSSSQQGWSAGIQFNPEKELFENLSVLKFGEKLSYRLGVFTAENTFSDQKIADFGTTFGIGIPILIQQSLSSVNLSFQLGKRSNESGSLEETYGGMQVGLVFCPSSFDRWFRKRKLD